MKKNLKKKDKPINWKKVVKVALQQDAIVKSVFCAKCVYLLGKLSEYNVMPKWKSVSNAHYLIHLKGALNILASQDKKIVTFKKKS